MTMSFLLAAIALAPDLVHGRAAPLLPRGLYVSCGPQWTLSQCEAEDLDASTAHGTRPVGTGFTIRVNFIGLAATRAQEQQLLAYDAKIGVKQYINVKDADKDGLGGTALVNGVAQAFAQDCGATTNQAVLKCIRTTLAGYSAFAGYYLYDEPGCPEASLGYCHGSLDPSQDPNVGAIASYLHATDPSHPVWGVQTPSGIPACTGGWTGSCAQVQIDNLFGWLLGPAEAYTGYDYYPIGLPGAKAQIVDIGAITGLITNTVTRIYPAEQFSFTVQAFAWCDYVPSAPCEWPTEQEMQQMRNEALTQNQRLSPLPMWALMYYSQDDENCLVPPPHGPPGCNAAQNWARLVGAAFVQSPPIRVRPTVR